MKKLFFVSLFVGLFAGVALHAEKEQATNVDFHTIVFKSHESYGADEYRVLQEENPEQFTLCLKLFKTIKTFDDIVEDGVFMFSLRKKQGKASVVMKSIVETLVKGQQILSRFNNFFESNEILQQFELWDVSVSSNRIPKVNFDTIIFKSHDSYGSDEYRVSIDRRNTFFNVNAFRTCLKCLKAINKKDSLCTIHLHQEHGRASLVMKNIVEALIECDNTIFTLFKKFFKECAEKGKELLLQVIETIEYWDIRVFRKALSAFFVENPAILERLFEKLPFSVYQEIMIHLINCLAETKDDIMPSDEKFVGLLSSENKKILNFFKENFVHYCIKELNDVRREVVLRNLCFLAEGAFSIRGRKFEKLNIDYEYFGEILREMLGNAEFRNGFSVLIRGLSLEFACLFRLEDIVLEMIEEEDFINGIYRVYRQKAFLISKKVGWKNIVKKMRNSDVFMNEMYDSGDSGVLFWSIVRRVLPECLFRLLL